jgi:hypothetical protein
MPDLIAIEGGLTHFLPRIVIFASHHVCLGKANAEWCIGSDFRRKDVAVLECLSERDADGLSLKFGAAERVA